MRLHAGFALIKKLKLDVSKVYLINVIVNYKVFVTMQYNIGSKLDLCACLQCNLH